MMGRENSPGADASEATCHLCHSRDGWHKWSCANLPPCGNPTPGPCENCGCKRAKETR